MKDFYWMLLAMIAAASFLGLVSTVRGCSTEQYQARLKCIELGKSVLECEHLTRFGS